MGSLGTASMSTRPSRCSTRKKQQRPFPRLFNLRPTDSIHVAGAADRTFSSQQDGGASVLSKSLRDSIPSLQEGALEKAMGFQAQLAESQEELAKTQSLVSAMEKQLVNKAGSLLLNSRAKKTPPVKQESSEQKSKEEVRACSHVLCLEKRPWLENHPLARPKNCGSRHFSLSMCSLLTDGWLCPEGGAVTRQAGNRRTGFGGGIQIRLLILSSIAHAQDSRTECQTLKKAAADAEAQLKISPGTFTVSVYVTGLGKIGEPSYAGIRGRKGGSAKKSSIMRMQFCPEEKMKGAPF